MRRLLLLFSSPSLPAPLLRIHAWSPQLLAVYIASLSLFLLLSNRVGSCLHRVDSDENTYSDQNKLKNGEFGTGLR